MEEQARAAPPAAAAAPSDEQAAADRRKELMRVLAGAQSIAIDVSRAPTFRRRFGEVMEAVSVGGSFSGSE